MTDDLRSTQSSADLRRRRCLEGEKPLSSVRRDDDGLEQFRMSHDTVDDSDDAEGSVAQEDGRRVVDATDTGRGISDDDLPHLFDRFYRADVSRSRATGGSGLGLSIARHLVEAHGGSINVASSLGTGSQFSIELPMDQPLVSAANQSR